MSQAATKSADFDQLQETGSYVDLQWDHLIKVIVDLWAIHQGHEQNGTPGDGTGTVTYYYVGTSSSARKVLRMGTDGTDFLVDKNTGTDAAPTWVNMVTINISSLAATLPAGLTIAGALVGVTTLSLGGDLTMGGNDILSAGAITATTVNGVDPSSHASRHAPGGSDALALGTPVAIGSANAAGSASTFPRSDHVHAGVREVDVDGAGSLQGAIDLVSGDGIRLARSGNQVTFERERYHAEISGGDDTLAAATEIIVQDSAGSPNLLQVQLSGADASKDYLASFSFYLQQATNASDLTIRVRVGSLGTTSDAVVFDFEDFISSARSTLISVSDLLIPSPALNDWVSISIESSAVTSTLKASGTAKPQLEVKAVAA